MMYACHTSYRGGVGLQSGAVAQVVEHLRSKRPFVQTPVLPKKKKENKTMENLFGRRERKV
jgi:hypothetical protein